MYPLLLGFDLCCQMLDIVVGHSGWPDRVLGPGEQDKVISG